MPDKRPSTLNRDRPPPHRLRVAGDVAALSPGAAGRSAPTAYRPYGYEQLREALAYGRRSHCAPDSEPEAAAALPLQILAAPSAADFALMSSLGVGFDGRAFSFAAYRYTRLADALLYARRGTGGGAAAPHRA